MTGEGGHGVAGERGTTCPECGTPREPDNTPACDCAERAAEALRETRTAEAAAAEDFDPLRIRPYVTTPPATTADPPPHTDFPDPPPAPAPRPRPPAPGEPADPGPDPGSRSRRALLLAGGGLGVALLAATAFALTSSYRTPAHDRAAQEIRQSVPDEPTRTPASPPAPAPPAARPATPPPSPAPATPSPTPTTASPTPSPTPTPSRTPSRTPSPTATSAPPTTPATAPVLRRGDTGPEVTELQQRLHQLNLYGDRIDGTYTRPVEDAVRNYQLARGIKEDPLGEYGPATRKSLETETRNP
ncbi:peptidoglycan-binding protein [Streptomyces achromogenes]|uniref:peptidoglycan-binding domain-containing protein n=1 Tax=Streptomyces achromogenes TaxID=67255 RepID=UPI00369BD717